MFRRILIAALIAGLAAGMTATVVQAARVWPLILAAETYETAAPAAAPEHDAADAAAHVHDGGAWAPADGFERMGFTLLFNLLAGFAFALLLNAALALWRAGGRAATATTGLLMGMVGFASFALAPALGLPPELPGMVAADLLPRQVWWLATALATAGGIAFIVLPRRLPAVVAGLALVAAPHLIGAPHPVVAEPSVVPAELAAGFVAASLASAAVFWAALGAISGWWQQRFG